MLTDRQNKIYEQITSLLPLSSSASLSERKLLFQAKNCIEHGNNFKTVVTDLILQLEEYESYQEISIGVEKLLKDLKAVYGEPETPKSDSDFIYVGGGSRYSGHWERKDEIKKGSKSARFRRRDILFGVAVMGAIGLLIFSPLLNWMQEKMGIFAFAAVMTIAALVLIGILIYRGRLKKNK